MRLSFANDRDIGQHTFVATLRRAAQKADEGWLRLPFDPLNRPLADQSQPVSRYMWVWKQIEIGRVAVCRVIASKQGCAVLTCG